MVTRESIVQMVFVAIAILTAVVVNGLFPDLLASPGGFTIGLAVFYGLALGGAHLYLFITGDGDEVPRSARARLLVAITVAFPLIAAGAFLEGERIAGVDVPVLLAILGGVVLVGYFIIEMRHGYADFAEEADLR